jgi:glutaminyl-peptide cyclotransferase
MIDCDLRDCGIDLKVNNIHCVPNSDTQESSLQTSARLKFNWNCKSKMNPALLCSVSINLFAAQKIMPSRFDYFRKTFLSFVFVTFLLYGSSSTAAPVYGYRVVAKYPHSTDSYTEGFFYLDGMFYEGTGISGRSAVMVINPKTGKSVQRRDLPAEYFGEGIVDWGTNIYEWTWKSHVCFVYDRLSLRPVKQFTYTGEGWGMTRTTKELITSDGTATLRFRDPNTFQETRHIVVKEGEIIVDRLNELEFIKAEIYANVWHSNMIARISPRDGHVIAWIDLTGLLPPDQMIDAESVLNGIAYDPQRDRLFVTGKRWPTVFEIKVVRRAVTR